MEDDINRLHQDNGVLDSGQSSKKHEEKQPETQHKSNKVSKKTLWIVVGITAGVIAVIATVIGALAANGVFDGDSCPEGKHEVCRSFDDGEEICSCKSSSDDSLPNDGGPNRSSQRGGDLPIIAKPMIYLYPEQETEVTVRLGEPENLTSSYPKYTDGWDVIAYPDGTLVDKVTGAKLYSLYWEGTNNSSALDKTAGFIVKGTDAAKFLEEKLEILGLNYKEKEEFIVYWLPKLESHNYNYIYFATEDEIEQEMPLELSVEPDTIIRVRMIFEGLDEYKEVEEQVLVPAPERNGFTVVEWGGTDLARQ